MTTPSSDVTIGALQVPAEMMPRVVAALRGQYGGVVGDASDDAVPALVLQWVIASAVEMQESTEALQGLDGAIESVRAEHLRRAEKAREKARRDLEKVKPGKAPAKKAAAARK